MGFKTDDAEVESSFSDISSIATGSEGPRRSSANACRWPGRVQMAEKVRKREEAARMRQEEFIRQQQEREQAEEERAAAEVFRTVDDESDEEGSAMSDVSDEDAKAVPCAVAKEPFPKAVAEEETHSGFSDSTEEEEEPLSPMSSSYSGPRVKFHVRISESVMPESFVVLVRFDWAPLAAQRFMDLIEADYFIEMRFHRVVSGCIAQFGIPADPALYEKCGPVEAETVKRSNLRGNMHFAIQSAGAPVTQISINLADNSYLDEAGCSPFAQVVSGMHVVDRLFAEYGQSEGSAPDPESIAKQGLAYLKDWPKLSFVVGTEVLPAPRSSLRSSRNTGVDAKHVHF